MKWRQTTRSIAAKQTLHRNNTKLTPRDEKTRFYNQQMKKNEKIKIASREVKKNVKRKNKVTSVRCRRANEKCVSCTGDPLSGELQLTYLLAFVPTYLLTYSPTCLPTTPQGNALTPPQGMFSLLTYIYQVSDTLGPTYLPIHLPTNLFTYLPTYTLAQGQGFFML